MASSFFSAHRRPCKKEAEAEEESGMNEEFKTELFRQKAYLCDIVPLSSFVAFVEKNCEVSQKGIPSIVRGQSD